MPADVNSISLVVNRPRDPANLGIRFEDEGLDISILEKLISGCKTRRPCADNKGGLPPHVISPKSRYFRVAKLLPNTTAAAKIFDCE